MSQTVTNAVNEVVHSYIEQIANKYNLEVNDLLSLWEGGNTTKVTKKTSKSEPKKSEPKKAPVDTGEEVDHSELKKLTKTELVAMCKAQNKKTTGTKAVLIGYLTGTEPEATSSSKKSPVTKTAAAKVKAVAATPVAKKIVPKASSVPIRRNRFGNFEHPETSFIFNNKSQKVIGKQNDNGEVDELTSDDINICNKYKFLFETPENLDKKSTLADVHVDELDDDEVFEDDEDEIVEDTEEELDADDFDDEFDEEEFEEDEAFEDED